MNAESLERLFHLSPQPKNADRFCIPDKIAINIKYRESAVLVPLVELQGQIHLFFTQRPMFLQHHSGQICFPGGKVKKEDNNIITTALRETEEEVGIVKKRIKVLGKLPIQHTYTGFKINPVVGVINNLHNLNIDSNEVDNCFTVPLLDFAKINNIKPIRTSQKGIDYEVLAYKVNGKIIWGVTASIIHVLCSKLGLITNEY
ncbi:CoA pyrophosphatase [Parashewanella spongiae]|uniref:CoA pyrophosphatase n=1 Tax=Parashewanella spongiae TaxID=342950 RepID=A0A3A6UCA4_9GAMM|nr:CoA pyrophosphatase [Parashewanella spongiae]MCL1078434.1 CoA pyrophosphatase [Parashewanella spongiae]RJY14850.1 CoA pyrophosphatase [Parashewanella spongiae]